MKAIKSEIPDVMIIEPEVFEDQRGFFYESYNQLKFEELTGKKLSFVQDNHSKSVKGVLRGLHYQEPPFAQAKLIRVIRGEIFDVVVDLRKESDSFGHWVSVKLNEKNKKQLWVPEGFAHGFLVLSDIAEISYKVTNFYSPNNEKTLLWNDPVINIQWPGNVNPTLSPKDLKGISYNDI